jgi:hypothetical protein
MRTIEQIVFLCGELSRCGAPGATIVLTEDEIKLLYATYCPEKDEERRNDAEAGLGCRGLFMGHPITTEADREIVEAQMCYLNYGRRNTPSSEPVRVGDTIKALMAGGLLSGGILKGSSHEK